jgi:hypothetical protein
MNETEENAALKRSLAELRKDYRLLKANYALAQLKQAALMRISRRLLTRSKKYRTALEKIGGVQPPDFSFVSVQGLVKKVLGK